jgi:hypothetical protein
LRAPQVRGNPVFVHTKTRRKKLRHEGAATHLRGFTSFFVSSREKNFLGRFAGVGRLAMTAD